MSRIQTCLQRHGVLLAIIGVGLLIRLAVLLLYLNTHEWKGETWEPEDVALSMLSGKGFVQYTYGDLPYYSQMAPLFPLLCYGLHLIGGPGLGLYYGFQLLVASGIIWLTYTIANRWFSSAIAAVAALLVSIEPGLVVFHSYKVDDISLGTLLILLVVHSFSLMTAATQGRLPFLTGTAMGVGVLTRSELVGLFGLLPVWMILEKDRSWKKIMKPLLLLVLCAAIVWSPWAARNYLLHGQFVLLTTYSGEALWRGNNPNSTGTTITLDKKGQFDASPVEFQDKIKGASEIQKNTYFREEAYQFILHDPVGFLVRAVKKFFYFWWFTPTYAQLYYDWVPPLLVEAYRFWYALLIVSAGLGAWIAWRHGEFVTRRAVLLICTVPFTMSVMHSITYVEGRHRVLVMPLVLILSAYGLHCGRRGIQRVLAALERE